MKKFYFVLILLFSLISSYAQTSGIFESYVLVDTGSGNIWYDIHSPTDLANDDITRDNFDGFNFGTIGTQNGTLTLNGGINNTFDCFPDQVVSGYLNYRIYPSSLPSGTYTGIDLSTNINNFGSACFGADTNQSWSTSNNNSNLLSGLSTGNYTIEVYSLADFNYDDGLGNTGSGIHYVNNNSNNFTAFFTADNPPTAICQDVTLTLDASGNATLTTADVDNGSTDDFDGATLIYSFDVSDQTAFTCADIATPVTVTLTVEDSQGQTASCTAQITVVDNTPPVITCPGNQTVNLDATCDATMPDYTAGVATDNCGATVTQVPAAGTTYNGQQTVNVVLTADDGNGNSVNCNFDVFFNDNTPPVITCPGNQTVNLDATCDATMPDYTAGVATDNCGATVTQVPAAGTTYNGQQTVNVVLTADDGNGNSVNCNFDVFFNDNTPPVITCPGNQTVNLDATCDATMPDYTAGVATDNCGATVTQVPAAGTTYNGQQTVNVVLTADDGNGNSVNCNFDVFFNDNTPPVITCPGNQTVNLDATCDATMPDYTAGVATDNCGATVTQVPAAGTTYNGQQTVNVVLTADDGNGNSVNCNFDVFFNDNTPPVITCPGNQTVNLDATCDATMPDYTAGVATDNCGATVTQVPAAGTTYNGQQTVNVVLTADDGNGNSVNCNFDVFFNDNTPPVITCPGNQTVNLDATCDATMPDYTAGVATDNCGATVTQVPAAGTTYNGQQTVNVVLTADDGNGNSVNCNFDVFFNDNTPPVITCPGNQTVNLDATCDATMPDYTAGVATDNCGATVTQVPAAGTTYNGQQTVNVVLTADDGNGNSVNCNFDVFFNDNTPPVITCPGNQTVNLDATCDATMPDYTAGVATDNCGATVTQVPAAGTTYNGQQTVNVVLTADDGNGNSVNCNFDVFFNDNTPPVITCPGNQTVNLDATCDATMPDYTTGVATDNCGATVTQVPAAGTTYNGQQTVNVVLTADDGNGNSVNCNFDVFFNDNTPPVITCPGNQTVNLDATCDATMPDYTTGVATDNCGATVTQVPAAGTTYNGQQTVNVVLTADDGNGNSVNCNFDVFFNDNTPPVITCPGNQTVNLDATCDATMPDYTTGVATDNCGATVTQVPAAGTTYNGQQTVNVVLTADDGNGNSVNCNFDVFFNDNTPPVITCPGNQTVNLDATCDATMPDYTAGVATDNCGATVTQVPAAGTTYNGQQTVNVVLTADDGNGNSVNCNFDVFFNDNTPPVITCPGNQTVNLDATCDATMPDYTAGVATDNCGATVTQVPAAGTTYNGQQTVNVVLTADDGNGNSVNCNFDVFFNDNTPPVITCPGNQTVNLDATCDATMPDYTAGVATDNCGATVTQVPAAGTTYNGQQTVNVVLTADDGNGNSVNCNFDVFFNDNTPPVITCPGNQTVNLDATCDATMPDYTAGVATDNCGATVTQVPAAGTTYNGQQTVNVVLTADDGNGNSVNCNFDVFFNDNTPPVITCPGNQTVNLDATCDATMPDYTAGVATDNCGATVTQVPAAGTTYNGQQTVNVVLTADDGNGNSVNCNFDVFFNDNTPPVITCPGNQTVNLDATCDATMPDYTAGVATDNCGATVTQVPAAGTTYNGQQTVNVVLTADDGNGNSVNCNFDVFFNDNTPPILTPGADRNVNLNASCQIIIPNVRGTATDNCGVTIVQSPAQGTLVSAVHNSPVTVTVTATDPSGNTDIETVILTPKDVTLPTISCPAAITVNNTPGNCSANVNYTLPTFGDNCSGATISQTAGIAPGGVFPVGTTTNTFRVTDLAGNTRSCSFTVTVTDTQPPVLTPAPNQNVNLNASCQILVPDVRGTATDNCTNPVTITQSPAPNLPVAATHNNPITVTVTATDASGNTDVETVIVTPVDVTAPTISCPGNQSVNFDAGCEYVLADYTSLGSASDNCDTNVTITQSPAVGTLLSGATTVTLTATDNAGNSDINSSCTFQVIPNDITPPNAVCQDITVSLGVTGSVNIIPTAVDGGSSDTCGPVFFSISDSNFTCADIGANTVTLTVSDNSGNTSSCIATVTVVDDTAPTMQCNNFVVVINPLTQVATINANDIDNGSNDACGLSNLTVSPNTFDTTQLGDNTVTLTATDTNGNSNTCTAIVTVEPPINEDTILTGTIVNPLEPGESPLPPSALIEATACPGGITAPRDIDLTLQAADPTTYNLQANQVIEWQISQDNGETWNVLPSSAGTLSYTLTNITDDTFIRVRVYDANDPTLQQFSSQVFIRFLPPDEPPILTSDPRFDICLGESVLLTAESFFDQPNGQFGEGGEFNYAQPDGWRVNYVDGDFPASGDNGREEDWKETNSNNNALFSNINYDTADNTKFALAHGVGNTTQLETPVFSTIGMTSAEAIMTFDTSFFFCNGGYGTIWLSFDSGVTYAPANELTAYWEGTNTPINFTTGNDTGIHVTKQGNCNSANSQRASTDPRMTAAYINLGPYVGLSGLRVRFEFFGSTSTCTNVAFPPAPGNNCNPVRTFDVASGWAIDNVGFAYAGVDDELEWTDEEGNIIAIGSQATVQPITPGIRNYGVTNLVNGCRAPGEDGTNDDTLVYTSLAYAGPDYIPSGNQCGENFVQLRAYDNTIKSRANYALGNWETGLYDVPVDDASDYDPTGVGGQWTIVTSTTTSCGNLATFSSNTDPNASFNASPGTYTLRWTLNDGSGCFDDVVVTVVDCPTIDFDGINDHIDFRNHYNFDSTYDTDGHFSIEVWVKPNSVNGTKTVFSRKDDAVNTAGYALTVVDGQVRFNWYKSAGSGSITSGGLSIGTDRWYHLAVTFNGSEYLMYVDGILISTQSGPSPDATPNNIKAILGATDQAPPNEATKYFHGWMDELRIWTRALDVQHIRQMMNQEIIASGANVMGTVIPTKIYGPDTNADGVEDDPLLWSELEGYYRMNVACGDFSPYKGVAGRLRNIQTPQQETAPLPYTSRANSSWDTDNTWTHFTVWDVPNSIGIDGLTRIDWNIVRTNHNISTDTRNLTVLGLLVEQNKLTVTDTGDANQNENNIGVGLWVTDYLKLNGEIDLVGESQLVQKRISTRQFNESILDVASAGNLERDQQGTTNLFNYNYFSSPVGAIGTTENNKPENLINLLLDGSNTNLNPHPVIQWTNSYNATGTTNPITLSNRWIYQYENYPWNVYAAWNYKGNTGTLDPGYGFTLKGSGVGQGAEGDIITGGNQDNNLQNYVFKGKPNNEDILVPITSYYQALVGNPYPSAIDANEFIDDNISLLNPDGTSSGANSDSSQSIEGTLYFWEHYTSNQTHILEEYEGGYAVLTKAGGVGVYIPALISGVVDPTPKIPQRYVPVGQGFFVGSIFDYSGDIKFENDQRVFQREEVSNSLFFRSASNNSKKSKKGNYYARTIDAVESQDEELVISRVRLNFTSLIDGKIRPLLLAFTSDNSASDGIDRGYDGSNTYFQNNDAFFIIEDGVYVIQGVGEFNQDKMYPLGIFLSENSDVEVSLTDLENFEDDIDVFIYDALLGTYAKLNDANFEANLDPDYYFDRFFITFKASSTLSDDEILKDDFAYVAYLDVTKDIYIKLPTANVTQVKLISVLGQTVRTWDTGLEAFYSNAYRIPVSGLPIGTYILNVETETTTISKKVIIK